MVKKPVSINLVKTDKNQTLNSFINWTLGAGRVLIIAVELIALSAFLYRFILDSQLRDIADKIKQEQAIVLQQKKNEDLYTNLQQRLALASSFSNQASDNIKIFRDIINFAPIGLNFTNLTLDNNTIRIQASVSSVYSLSSFINSLKSYSKTDTVSIDKIENKTENAVINVSISVMLKKEANAGIN